MKTFALARQIHFRGVEDLANTEGTNDCKMKNPEISCCFSMFQSSEFDDCLQ